MAISYTAPEWTRYLIFLSRDSATGYWPLLSIRPESFLMQCCFQCATSSLTHSCHSTWFKQKASFQSTAKLNRTNFWWEPNRSAGEKSSGDSGSSDLLEMEIRFVRSSNCYYTVESKSVYFSYLRRRGIFVAGFNSNYQHSSNVAAPSKQPGGTLIMPDATWKRLKFTGIVNLSIWTSSLTEFCCSYRPCPTVPGGDSGWSW